MCLLCTTPRSPSMSWRCPARPGIVHPARLSDWLCKSWEWNSLGGLYRGTCRHQLLPALTAPASALLVVCQQLCSWQGCCLHVPPLHDPPLFHLFHDVAQLVWAWCIQRDAALALQVMGLVEPWGHAHGCTCECQLLPALTAPAPVSHLHLNSTPPVACSWLYTDAHVGTAPTVCCCSPMHRPGCSVASASRLPMPQLCVPFGPPSLLAAANPLLQWRWHVQLQHIAMVKGPWGCPG
jgi:hypothetical protein